MGRKVKLYPGSDPTIFDMPFWCDIEQDESSTELWIDFHVANWRMFNGSLQKDPLDLEIVQAAERIVLYDWFHGREILTDAEINWVRQLNTIKPVTWITLNPKPIDGIKTVKFDYYWNRTKRAFWEQQLFHKQNGIENFVQYPIRTDVRSRKYLSYHSRLENYREIIRLFLQNDHQGFCNDPVSNEWLLPNSGKFDSVSGQVSPPAQIFYDQSYVTCLVETQYLGTHSHLVSEKTYDNIIQGRGVLNFATPGFYQHLQSEGWKLPNGIDWSWNQIEKDSSRLAAYLVQLDRLFGLSPEGMHDWFMSNMSCWQHNQRMLEIKPYDIIDLSSI